MADCIKIQTDIEAKTDQLGKAQKALDDLFNQGDFSSPKTETVINSISLLREALSQLKAEQVRNKCLTNEPLTHFQDNQTVISTSSVRRKDSKALQTIVPDQTLTK